MRFQALVVAVISALATTPEAASPGTPNSVLSNNAFVSEGKTLDGNAALRGTEHENENELPGLTGEDAPDSLNIFIGNSKGKNEHVSLRGIEHENELPGDGIPDYENHRFLLTEQKVDDFEYMGTGWCVNTNGNQYGAGKVKYPTQQVRSFQACASYCPRQPNFVGLEDRQGGYCMCLYDTKNGGMPPQTKFDKVFTNGRNGEGPVVQSSAKSDQPSMCYKYLETSDPSTPDFAVRKNPPNGFSAVGQGKCRDMSNRWYRSGTIQYGAIHNAKYFGAAVNLCPKDGLVGVQDTTNNEVQCLYDAIDGNVPPFAGFSSTSNSEQGTGLIKDGGGGQKFYCYQYDVSVQPFCLNDYECTEFGYDARCCLSQGRCVSFMQNNFDQACCNELGYVWNLYCNNGLPCCDYY